MLKFLCWHAAVLTDYDSDRCCCDPNGGAAAQGSRPWDTVLTLTVSRGFTMWFRHRPFHCRRSLCACFDAMPSPGAPACTVRTRRPAGSRASPALRGANGYSQNLWTDLNTGTPCRILLDCASQMLHFFQSEGLWQACVEQFSQCHFPTGSDDSIFLAIKCF